MHLPPFVFATVAFLVTYELAFAWLDLEWTIPIRFDVSCSEAGFALSTKQNGTPWDTLALIALWVYCGIAGRGASDPAICGRAST